MAINRRKFLKIGAGSAVMALVGTSGTGASAKEEQAWAEPGWHPLTQSLLLRAREANTIDGRANTASIERLIRDVARAQGRANPPVIKWLADPFEAYAHLSRLGLGELLQMNDAQLWRRAGPTADLDEDRLNSYLVLGGMIGDTVRSSDHDRLLMAPKLRSKARVMAENPSAEAAFNARAVAAQIGWLETCLPAVAAQAVTEIELLLSSGASEKSIHHQLRVFEAYELGLLATWETPAAVICIPRVPAV